MGEDDRHSKSTAELDRGELAKLASRSVATDVVELAHRDRKTQRMRARHLQALLRSGQAITPDMLEAIDWHADADEAADADIEIPREPEAVLDELARNELAPAAILHEEVASSSLIAQAFAQLEARGDEELRIRRPVVQTTEISPIEELASLGRSAPMTIPSPNRITEAAASAPATIPVPLEPKPSRPAIEMKPLERPLASGTEPIEAKPIGHILAAGTEPLEPVAPVFRLSRADFEPLVAPRSDIGLTLVVSFVMLAIAAAIVGLALSS